MSEKKNLPVGIWRMLSKTDFFALFKNWFCGSFNKNLKSILWQKFERVPYNCYVKFIIWSYLRKQKSYVKIYLH